MKKDADKDLYTKMGEIDFANAKNANDLPSHVQNALKNRPQPQRPAEPVHAIEPDVWQLIREHMDSPTDMKRLNGVIRGLFGTYA